MGINKNIKRYSFKDSLPLEFELVSLSDLYLRYKTILTVPHRTEFYHIIWFQQGRPTHWVDFEPVKIQPNSLLFINKDKVQSFDKSGGYEGKALLFTEGFFCQTESDRRFLHSTMLHRDIFSTPIMVLGKSLPAYSRIFDAVEEELNNRTDIYQSLILQNLLHNLLFNAERAKQKGSAKSKNTIDVDYVLLFCDFIDKQFKEIKFVKGYVQQIHISEKRLNQATSKVYGKTPKELIDGRVILEAKRLLVYGAKSVKEIGIELGFDEPTNFIKYFRKHTNTTPTEFREKHLL